MECFANSISMYSIRMQCMNFHVGVLMTIIYLQCKHTGVAYLLEKDISHLTGMDPPKRWLVFMEVRVKRCIKLQSDHHWIPADLLSFLQCLIVGPKPQTQCTRSLFPKVIQWKVNAVVSSNRILFRNNIKRSRYCPIRQQRYRLLVHKLFGFNLTIDEFTTLDSSHVLPLPGECTRARAKFVVSYNNGSITYCGKRTPWSIYSNFNMATIELILTQKWESYHIKLSMRIGAVDPFYSTKYPSLAAGPSAWGYFTIFTYHIAVEMIYRVRVSLSLDFLKFKFYDGPDANMPRLPVYRKFSNQNLYISSTFQLFCVFASKSTNLQFTLQYTPEHATATHVITPNQEILLKNNTGCGNDKVLSWMCTFRIVSPNLTTARVHISMLNINGIFANMHAFAGLAIYNIISNKTSLIGYWCYGILRKENWTFTGSENQLIISFYAYSPYSLLSCNFFTYSSNCVGSFIGKRLRPSMVLIPRHISYENITPMTSTSKSFYIFYDVTNHCHVIHICFLPIEYALEEPSIRIFFWHEKIVKLTRKSIFGISAYGPGLWSVTVSGTYSRTLTHVMDPVDILSNDFEITGDIRYIHMDVLPTYSDIPITILTVSPMSCTQRCSSLTPVFASTGGRISTCNICKHEWLDFSSRLMLYEMKPYASVTFERMHGFNPVAITVIPFALHLCLKNEFIKYYSHSMSLRFLSGDAFYAFVQYGEYWRFDKGQVAKVHENLGSRDCLPLTTVARVRHWRMNVYIVVSEFQVFSSSWQQWQAHCERYGGDILTIDDQQELYYVMQNIMVPFAVSLTTIGIINQVWLLVNSTVINHGKILLSSVSCDNSSCIRRHKPEYFILLTRINDSYHSIQLLLSQ